MFFMKHKAIPGKYQVIVDIVPTKKNGLREPYSSRIGGAHDLDGVRKLIENHKRNCRDTLGGLIDPLSTSGQTFRVYEATYKEVQI